MEASREDPLRAGSGWAAVPVSRRALGFHGTLIRCAPGWEGKLETELSGLARLALTYLGPYEQMRFLRRYLGEGVSNGRARKIYERVRNHLRNRPPERGPVRPRSLRWREQPVGGSESLF